MGKFAASIKLQKSKVLQFQGGGALPSWPSALDPAEGSAPRPPV